MKKSKLFVVVILIALCALGWTSIIFQTTSDSISYYDYIKKGDKLVESGLYQRAISSYNLALKEKETQKIYEKINTAYKKRYKEAPDETFDDYKSFLVKSVIKYPANHSLVDSMVEIYRIDGKYKEMYNCISNAISAGYKTDEIKEKLLEAKYAFNEKSSEFMGLDLTPNTKYTVKRSEGWNLYDITEGYLLQKQYKYIGVYGEEGVYTIVDEDGRLVNDEGTVLGIFDDKVTESGVYSEGLIPVCCNKSYSYYNDFAEKQFGDYEMAGMFQNGLAAVKEGGKWMLINNKGKVKSSTFDEIILDGMGRYFVGGVAIAKVDGKYGIYDKNLKLKAKLDCSKVDLPTSDGIIAVCSGGKWGFVNSKGKTVVKAQFNEAKSFSNGLAAVCKNGKWGFINTDGKVVIDYQFTDAGYFNDNLMCPVRVDDINKNVKSNKNESEEKDTDETKDSEKAEEDKATEEPEETEEINYKETETWKFIEIIVKSK